MNIKELKNYSKLSVGNNVRISNRMTHAPHLKHTTSGVIASVKGLNGSTAEVRFENGSRTYFSWRTATVEIV